MAHLFGERLVDVLTNAAVAFRVLRLVKLITL
jgi:hypothetical protein